MYRVLVMVGDAVTEAEERFEKRQAAVYHARKLRRINPWAEYWVENVKEWPNTTPGRQIPQ